MGTYRRPRTPSPRWLLGLGAVGLAAVAMAACGDGGDDTLVIAVEPTSTPAELTADAAEIEDFLEERLDVDVEMRFPTSYAGVIESLHFGHADAAFMGAWPAALAASEADSDIVLAEVREVVIDDEETEAPFYFSYFVVEEDSEYGRLADLEGARVAFPSPLSTSGYVAPVARMVELGLIEKDDDGVAHPEDFFDEVVFAGGYAQGYQALTAGQVDATVIAGDVPQSLYEEVLAGTRVIEQQGPVPSHAVVFSDDLEDPLRSDLEQALIELGSDENRELMRKFISGIFLRFEPTTTEEHVGQLQTYIDLTGLTFTEASSEPGAEPDPEADPEPEADPAQETSPAPEADPEPEAGIRPFSPLGLIRSIA